MARMSGVMDDVPVDVEDLRPITEEMNPAERAEYDLKLHAVQPSPANKLVLLWSPYSRPLYFHPVVSFCLLFFLA